MTDGFAMIDGELCHLYPRNDVVRALRARIARLEADLMDARDAVDDARHALEAKILELVDARGVARTLTENGGWLRCEPRPEERVAYALNLEVPATLTYALQVASREASGRESELRATRIRLAGYLAMETDPVPLPLEQAGTLLRELDEFTS